MSRSRNTCRGISPCARPATSIQPQTADEDGLFRFGLEQFLTEARTLAQLDHPNIVRVRQFFAANGSAHLVMDYYRGLTLSEYLARQPGGRMPEALALALMQPILDGLRAVHAQGFLHRDIKLANIYLAKTQSGGARPILLDFGAARQAVGERSRSLSVLVSEGYAPFEQHSRKGPSRPLDRRLSKVSAAAWQRSAASSDARCGVPSRMRGPRKWALPACLPPGRRFAR